MTKARILADFISDGSSLADGTISVAEVSGAAPLASPTFTGTASGTFSGPLTGAVTGNVTGAVTGNVTGNLTGDVLGDLDLTAISATIADTAVDIFVYDTSKDSDGGAWRKRTQGTSWYNETLGTGTRGSRKEFPAVAVIVAESSQVTIYDGDDPDLPMWMVFNNGGTAHGSDNVIGASGDTMSSISMLSGIMMIGTNAARLINFVSEVAYRYSTSGAKPYNGTIAERNSGKGTGTVIASLAIVNNTVNDVAMTVLPNAPIDAATGLPVPTIAVATNGGVSVIKDDGTVVDLTGTNASYTFVYNIAFTQENRLWFAFSPSGSNDNYNHLIDIPTSDTAIAHNATASVLNDYYYDSGTVPAIPRSTSGATRVFVDKATATNVNLTLLDDNTPSNSTGSVAYITSTYNTGWMNGDIKLATLSDTDATDVTGSELVTNGTFANNGGDWSFGGGWNFANGQAEIDTTNNDLLSQDIGMVSGKTYTVSLVSDCVHGWCIRCSSWW
jgi:trimeric autotransporter adhesin